MRIIPTAAGKPPSAPWWNWSEATSFSPNPCAAAASALIRFGTDSQQKLGHEIAEKCLELLKSDGFCGEHDTLNMQALVEQLHAIHSPLIDDGVISSMRRRIVENTSFDRAKWSGYYFHPLEYVSSPDSMWYRDVEAGIEETLSFFLETIGEEGVWQPNFSWGENSDISRQVTENWKGYITVKRAKILRNFGRIEGME